MQFPEIEQGLLSPGYYERLQMLEASSTDVDLLEIVQAPSAAVSWQQGLSHERLVAWFQRRSKASKETEHSALRIFFLNSNVDMRIDFYSLKLHPSTLEWFQTQHRLPVLFSECIVNISKWAKIGNGCFHHYDGEGRVVGIDILYRLGTKGGATHVWCSHQMSPKSTTYIISNCPKEVKDRIVSCASDPTSQAFCRPLVMDTILADACSWQCRAEIEDARRYLVSYEYYGTSKIPSGGPIESFESLHRLSQTWHILHEDLIDFEERIQFLLDVCAKLDGAYVDEPRITTAESIAFLASRTQIWRRWVANYNKRTKIRIDLFFNLAIQNDSRKNTEIARLTKDIAQESRKDSSSMITIAVLTMFFLPGTFVSAMFSMVFFYNENDKNGNVNLAVMPQWWYFLVITIGLTILVFATWLVWQRLQGKKLNSSLRATNSGERPWRNSPASLSNVDAVLAPPPPPPQFPQGQYRGRYFGGTVDPALSYQF